MKPMTENQKQVANSIYKYLATERRFVCKAEICNFLGWAYTETNDRKIRDTINLIKKKRPIVATPDSKGYFAPLKAEDLGFINKQLNYINSVIQDLEETKKPLIEFYEKFKK